MSPEEALAELREYARQNTMLRVPDEPAPRPGTVTPDAAPPRTLTSGDIQKLLDAAGCGGAFLRFILDRAYALPAVDYIQRDFAAWFWAEQYRRGIATWSAEKNDCDNFAVRALADLGIAHARSAQHTGAGLAFGLFIYAPDGQHGLHAINFAIVGGPTGPHVVWFEPQPQASTFGLVSLTETERNSCIGYFLC